MSYVTKRIRLIVPANKAKPSPAIGQALGSIGVNMMKFCKEFNAQSAPFIDDLPLRVSLSVLNDGQYRFTTQLPQSSFFIKKMVGLDTLAHSPGHEIVGQVHCKQLYELAKLKAKDGGVLATTPLRSIFKSLLASCKSYGVDVSFEKEDERRERIAREEEKKKSLPVVRDKKGAKKGKKK